MTAIAWAIIFIGLIFYEAWVVQIHGALSIKSRDSLGWITVASLLAVIATTFLEFYWK